MHTNYRNSIKQQEQQYNQKSELIKPKGNIKCTSDNRQKYIGIDKKLQYNCHSSIGSYQDTNNFISGGQCEHLTTIDILRQRLRKLKLQERQLQKQNDDIMRSMQTSCIRHKRMQKDGEIWKIKYQKLKADNDRKAVKLTFSPLSPIPIETINRNQFKQLNRQRRQMSIKQLKNPQKYQLNSTKPRQQGPVLTKQQKQYVRHLQSQQQKRRRTNSNLMSMRNLYSYQHQPTIDRNRHKESQFGEKTQRKYSARLEDGLIIHIIDDRAKNKQRQRAKSYKK